MASRADILLYQTTNLTDREIDNLLDAYEKLGDKIPLLYEYTPFFTRFKESESCLLHIYRDVSAFHQNLYKLFSLRSGCEIDHVALELRRILTSPLQYAKNYTDPLGKHWMVRLNI